MKKNVKEPFADLKKWEKIVNFQLTVLGIVVTIGLVVTLIFYVGGDNGMEFYFTASWWASVFGSIVATILTTVSTTLFIYFKFLKRVPEETKKQIDTLLNDRLNYETTNHNAALNQESLNHNAVLSQMSQNKTHLSSEHSIIIRDIVGVTTTLAVQEERKSVQYHLLDDAQRMVVDSTRNIEQLSTLLMAINEQKQDLSRSLSEKEAVLKAMQGEIKSLEATVKNIKEENKALSQRCRAQEAALSKLKPQEKESFRRNERDDFEL